MDQNGDGTQDFLVIAAGRTLSDADIRWTTGSAPAEAEAAPILCVTPGESELGWML